MQQLVPLKHIHTYIKFLFHFDYIICIQEYEKISPIRLGYLPQGIAESKSDMELKPLWFPRNQMKKVWKSTLLYVLYSPGILLI